MKVVSLLVVCLVSLTATKKHVDGIVNKTNGSLYPRINLIGSLCSTPIHLHFPIEPISAKSPAFQTESMSATFRKVAGQAFALLCQAQAYPVPSIR